METNIEYRKPLHRGELDPHRRENTRAGMWAWLWQRISALAVLVLVTLHVTLTYRPIIQFLLLLAITFHAALGVRVILLDFNVVSVKYQRALAWGLAALGLVVMAIVWVNIYESPAELRSARQPEGRRHSWAQPCGAGPRPAAASQSAGKRLRHGVA